MQGSFSPQSASEFLRLMGEAGYDVENNLTGQGREDFSGGASNKVDPWQGNVAEFGEVRGEYIENYDYTRCVRPDGSAYGTSGKCRKGTESAEELQAIGDLSRMLPKGEKIISSTGSVHSSKGSKPRATEENVQGLAKKISLIDRKIEAETKALGKMLKGAKYEGLRKKREEKIGKLKAAKRKMAQAKEELNRQLNEDSKKTGRPRPLMASNWDPGFSELENYDFARCVRPDGSAYGTRGKCRKGTESSAGGENSKDNERVLRGLTNKYKDLYLKVEAETKKLGKMLKGPKYEAQREARKAKIQKLRESLKKVGKARDAINARLDKEVRETGRPRQLMPDNWQGFSESDNYDFARCVRPDGSVYGTKGKCRKGTEASAQPKKERTAAEILKELDKLPKGTSPRKEALLKEYFNKVGTAPSPAKRIKDPVPGVLKSQEDLKDFNRKENQRITDLVAAGKVKGVDPDAIRRIRAKKMMERINQETDPRKQRDLINQLEEINNPLVKLPGGRVARSRDLKSPYEL